MLVESPKTAAYYSKLAKEYDLKRVDLKTFIMDFALLNRENHLDYLKLQAIPIESTQQTLTVATGNPTAKNQQLIENYFHEKTGKRIKFVIASLQDISLILAKRFETEDTHAIAYGRDELDKLHSAARTFSLTEKIIISTVIGLLLIAAVYNFFPTLLWFNVFLASGTLVIMSYKMGLTIHSFRFLIKKPKEKIEALNEYPIYTVLLPLLFEKQETLVLLLESLNKLDYPQDKLDIKFLLEKNDVKTAESLARLDLAWNHQVIIVPDGLPRSKPRACNYGLLFAFGDYLTIYDAEDRPDPDQLKLALHHFQNADENVACIQAALNFYNYRENILARLFTIEYTHWFDCLVPSLDALHVPVPLGGTSNHFKTSVLRELRGWDPFVGTEDAEIGVRLCRHGYRVESIRSTTYEEANTKFFNWFRQRTRWNKGYYQTYLINMRDPLRMLKEVGAWQFINFQFFVGGNVFIQLANLPLWIFFILTFILYHKELSTMYPMPILHICWFNFIVSNLILLISQFAATYKRHLYCLLPYVPLKLIYWFCMSFAGYYAIYELLTRPGYWYKTEHGVSKEGRKTDIPLS